MTKEKLKELQFVILAVILGSIMVMCYIFTDFNTIDLIYMFFLGSCLVRYLYIVKKNER